ncbi:uncharacterized protein RJT20DRAFT_386 [Scheffersomyces xylosifermentans]|uniref:uncharacterized protein n=1 Tax=Scheffersomyces xylosifermentans TaxID=1304137 RepID=UPI00315CCB2A
MYREITIDVVCLDDDGLTFDNFKDKTNDIDDLIIDEYCSKDVALQRMDDLSIFNTVYNFISFLEHNQAFVPKSIKFDVWSLLQLSKSHPEFLTKVDKLDVDFNSRMFVVKNELLQQLLDLHNNIDSIELSSLGKFSSSSLRQLSLSSLKEDVQLFFEKVPNLMILELHNTDIRVDDFHSYFVLKNENLDFWKFDLPSRLNEFQLCIDRSDGSFFTGENSIVDLSHLLNLTKVTFTAKGMDSLDQLILPFGIEDLKLQGCEKLSSIVSVSKCKNLLNLNIVETLSENDLTDIRFLKAHTPSNVKVLYLRRNYLVDCHLNNLEELHTLDLSDNLEMVLAPDKLRLPASLKVFKIKRLPCPIGGFIMGDFSEFKDLKSLDLSGCDFFILDENDILNPPSDNFLSRPSDDEVLQLPEGLFAIFVRGFYQGPKIKCNKELTISVGDHLSVPDAQQLYLTEGVESI